MATSILTPKLKLAKIISDVRNWARTMNDNLSIIDAVVSAYMVVNNLKGVWSNSTSYGVGDRVVDPDTGALYSALVPHVSAPIPATFTSDFAANPTFWTLLSTSLGFGNAAYLNAGTSPNNVVQLNGSAQVPRIDGSLMYPFASFVRAFAIIRSDGVIIANQGIASVNYLGAGSYKVNYPANFGAAYLSLTSNQAGVAATGISFALFALIDTTNVAGAPTDATFTIIVLNANPN